MDRKTRILPRSVARRLVTLALLAPMTTTLVGAAPDDRPSAAKNLDAAIDVLRREHVNRDRADWDRLIAIAHGSIADAERPADAYPVIRLIIEALGEKHTMLIESPDTPGLPPIGGKPGLPRHELRGGRFGFLTVPRYAGSRERGEPYAAALRDGLRELNQAGACGFVLDLRGNGGRNVWPMLDGVGALIERDVLLSFEAPGFETIPVRWRGGRAVQEGGTAPTAPASQPDPRIARKPVALLIDGGTASSAEALLVAFAGRPATQRFGRAKADYGTVNNNVPLPDGALLLVTVGWNRDVTDRRLEDAIQPDHRSPPENALTDAERWLGRQPGCR